MTTAFYFNNHNGSSSPSFIGLVATLPNLCVEKLPSGVRESNGLVDATHGAIHLGEGELVLLKRDWPEPKTVQAVILLRVSESGRDELARDKHDEWHWSIEGKTVSVYILNVRNYAALTAEFIAEFCRMNVTQAEAVRSEKLDDLPPVLREVFRMPTEASTLTALSILCQGYLAVQRPSDFGVDAEAQRRLAECGAAADVARASWWLDVFGSVAVLTEALQNEWTLSHKARKDVDTLVKAIVGQALTFELVRAAEKAIGESLKGAAGVALRGDK